MSIYLFLSYDFSKNNVDKNTTHKDETSKTLLSFSCYI